MIWKYLLKVHCDSRSKKKEVVHQKIYKDSEETVMNKER